MFCFCAAMAVLTVKAVQRFLFDVDHQCGQTEPLRCQRTLGSTASSPKVKHLLLVVQDRLEAGVFFFSVASALHECALTQMG